MAEYECLRGWYADHSSEYGWTSVHDDPRGLPKALEGRLIVVELGPPGEFGTRLEVTKVEEVLERKPDRVVVRDTKPPWYKSTGE